MNEIHELDAAREELRRALPSDDARRAANRRALTAHMTVATDAKPGAANPTAAESPAAKPAARPPRVRRRWVPAVSLGAVAATACVAFAIVALQPSGNGGSSGGEQPARAPELRLAGAGNGALAALKLDQASAADVLRAAGESAAAGAPDADGAPWSYFRYSNTSNGFQEQGEKWTSPDGDRTYSLVTYTGQDATGADTIQLMAHFLDMKTQTSGTVTWKAAPDGTLTERSANWNEGSAQPPSEHLTLEYQLHDAVTGITTAEGIRTAIDDALTKVNVTFRGGMVCTGDGGTCLSQQVTTTSMTDAQAREVYARHWLVTLLGSQVHDAETTQAMYELLATSPGAQLDTSTKQIIIRFPVAGAPKAQWERITLDPQSGRITERRYSYQMGGFSTMRWDAVGVATAPAVATSEVCDRYPAPCTELRELALAHETNPTAEFTDAMSAEEQAAQFRERFDELREEALAQQRSAEGARGG